MVLNTRLGLNININPDLFNSQALDYKFPIRIDTSEKAIESYQEGLKKLNIQLVKKGSKYFADSSTAEFDYQNEINAILGSKSYTILSAQLRPKSSQSQLHAKLHNMAKYIANNEKKYNSTNSEITNYISKFKSLEFRMKNAASGSSLRPPDPALVSTLKHDLDNIQNEIIQKASDCASTFLSTCEEYPAEIEELFATNTPKVILDKIMFDNLLILLRTYEAYTSAFTNLRIDISEDERRLVKSGIEKFKKDQSKNNLEIDEYKALIRKVSETSNVLNTEQNQEGISASIQLYDNHGDRRGIVRQILAEKITKQYVDKVIQLRNSPTAFKFSLPETMLFFGSSDLENCKNLSVKNSKGVFYPDCYKELNNGRTGAVSGLVVSSATNQGKVNTYSVSLGPKKHFEKKPEVGLENYFGSNDKQVSINTSDTEAEAYIDKASKASIKDSLDLIEANYDPNLFRSAISIAFDKSYNLAYGGDSAGVALGLSALSFIKKISIDKRIAVTGSVRRFGDVRAVGGIYQKASAAFAEGCIALILPSANIENLFALPVEIILGNHVFTVGNFAEASGIVQVGHERDNINAMRSIKLYNYAIVMACNGMLSEALSFSEAATHTNKTHFSAQVLNMLLKSAEIAPSDSLDVKTLISEINSNLLPKIPENEVTKVEIRKDTNPVFSEFNVSGITGIEAINKLVNEVKKNTGLEINLVVNNVDRTNLEKNKIYFNFKDEVFLDILGRICTLANAKFEQSNDLIIINPRD
jgi:hypothetical protein